MRPSRKKVDLVGYPGRHLTALVGIRQVGSNALFGHGETAVLERQPALL